MENILINPDNYDSQYLGYLNECFKNWGKDDTYNWVFKRTVGDINSDIIIIKDEEDEVIAGSGVSYRKLTNSNGDTIDIAIMTGSWTLPKARGKGCFSKMIEVSRSIASQKNVPYLTAFVTEANASFRRLHNAGSNLVPTYHLFSPSERFSESELLDVRELEKEESILKNIYLRLVYSNNYTKFEYSYLEFKEQYLYRPAETILLEIGTDYVVVEETDNVVKVLFATCYKADRDFEIVIKSLTNWALENTTKKILYFTTLKEVSNICEKIGFQNLPGYFTILTSLGENGDNLLKNYSDIVINSGDKI